MDDDYSPTIPGEARTIAYFAIGIAAPVVGVAVTVVSVVAPDLSAHANTIGVSLLSALGTVAGLFGIAYRPTKTL